jgi:hypothetical protein
VGIVAAPMPLPSRTACGEWDNSGQVGPAVGECKFVANRVQVCYRHIYPETTKVECNRTQKRISKRGFERSILRLEDQISPFFVPIRNEQATIAAYRCRGVAFFGGRNTWMELKDETWSLSSCERKPL